MEDSVTIDFLDRTVRGAKVAGRGRQPRIGDGPRLVYVDELPSTVRRLAAKEIPLMHQITPAVNYVAKLYPPGKEGQCQDELDAWRRARESPIYHAVPAVVPVSSAVAVDGELEWTCILAERAPGYSLDEW